MGRTLLEWDDNDDAINYELLGLSVFVTLSAGIMSGLTLGLMSLDTTQMEVLLRSGTPAEKKNARKIMPIIKNAHHLLVTLLMCNAGAMTTLPLFLDRLVDPVTALCVSVTAVLFFGEIIPQAVCSKYGLIIGARLAWLVRLLMLLTSPVSWTLGKVLDLVLGTNHNSLFRRQQLKALVDIHGEATGMGGKLSLDEIKVITGALDLTNKIAYRSMTPLRKVMTLSTDDRLDEATLRIVLDSGHSRIPVHRAGSRSDVVGLLLVKELLQYKMTRDVPVAALKMRSLPRLSAATPMYDMLKLFQTGRSHMAVLTQPEVDDEDDQQGADHPDEPQQLVEAMAVAAIQAAEDEKEVEAHRRASASQLGSLGRAGVLSSPERPPQPRYSDRAAAAVSCHTPPEPGVSLREEELQQSGDEDSSMHSGSQRRERGGGRVISMISAEGDGGPSAASDFASQQGSETVCVNLGEFHVEYEEDGGVEDAPPVDDDDDTGGAGTSSGHAAKTLDKDAMTASRKHRTRVPKLAAPGEPIGIITIEDVIEELIRTEIVDETDKYVDNHLTVRVETAMLAAALPDRLRQAVAGGALPVDVMLKTNLGRRTMSKGVGLHAALTHLTAPLLPPPDRSN